MKKLIFPVILVLPILTLYSNERPQRAGFNAKINPENTQNFTQFTLKGSIKAPRDWKNVPEFRLFFNGKETVNDEDGFFSFQTDQNLEKLYVAICKNVEQKFNGINTIQNLKTLTQKPYKIFSFKKIETEKEITWIQKEKSLEKKDFVLPENCLVAVINPKYVEDVKNWNITLTNNFIKFPQITLKEDLSEKKVKREAVKSLLRSLDAVTFHEPVKIANKEVDTGIKISLSK